MKNRSLFVIATALSALFWPLIGVTEDRDGKVGTKVSVGKALSKISSALKSKGITKLPSTSSLVSVSSSSSTILPQAVSGTPPTLLSIPGTSIKDLFWVSGVVDAIAGGSPTMTQCRQFFASSTDGDSGGLGACQMTEAVGHSFETLLNAETSLCYMKNLPTKANLQAGGIELVRGKFPGGNVEKLFSPGKKTRIVKINTESINDSDPKETIFVQIPSIELNEKRNLIYSARLYFCPLGQPGPRGFNAVDVTSSGKMKLTLGNRADPFGGGAHSLTVQGRLTFASQAVAWDPKKTRTSVLNVVRDTENFKADVSISSENVITQKIRHAFAQRVSKNFSVAKFSGSDINALRVLEGAFTEENKVGPRTNSNSGGNEYRDTYYAAAPSSPFIDDVDDFEFSSDSFFSDGATADVDTSRYSCSPDVDVELSMIQGNDTLKNSLAPCRRLDFADIQFCRKDDTVQAALQNFPTACIGGGGPPP